MKEKELKDKKTKNMKKEAVKQAQNTERRAKPKSKLKSKNSYLLENITHLTLFGSCDKPGFGG